MRLQQQSLVVIHIPQHQNVISQDISIRAAGNVYDPESNPIGYIEYGYYPRTLINLKNDMSFGSALQNAMLSNVADYAAISPENKQVVYSSQQGYIGASSTDIGLSEESLKDGFSVAFLFLEHHVMRRDMKSMIIWCI